MHASLVVYTHLTCTCFLVCLLSTSCQPLRSLNMHRSHVVCCNQEPDSPRPSEGPNPDMLGPILRPDHRSVGLILHGLARGQFQILTPILRPDHRSVGWVPCGGTCPSGFATCRCNCPIRWQVVVALDHLPS
jgi:hypothetical protein